MKITIQELLEKKKVKLEETIYKGTDDTIQKFVITSGDFYKIEDAQKWDGSSWLQERFDIRLQQKRESALYKALEHHYEELGQAVCRIKEADPKGYDHMSELRALRSAKRGIAQSLSELTEYYEAEIEEELKEEYGVGKRKLFVYKNTVTMGSFLDLKNQMKELSELSLPRIQNKPLFFGNIKALKESLDRKLPIGIVGGPCLFGTHEMELQIVHKDGSTYLYDFCRGHNYNRKENINNIEFAEHIEKYAKEIKDIHFCNKKAGITAQEYESLEILFVFAEALNAKTAIPIPDISYQKYLYTVLEPIEESMRENIMQKFCIETRKITDLYLGVIEDFKKKYPKVEVCVLHERAEAVCEVFHKKREAYFKNSGLIHRMTTKRKKTDAIFDYISMLALPYYLWGTPQVIQIDNLDETDSFRKCKKVHKEAFRLSSILYPERLSRNNEDTIFNAPLDYKEYVTNIRKEEIDE